MGKRTFVRVGDGHGQGSLSIKTDPASQAFLLRRGPYERTPYIGQHGYRLVAPKRLVRALDDAM